MRHLFFLLAFVTVAQAQQNQWPVSLGWQPNYVEHGGSQDDTYNTNTDYRAWGFNLSTGKTLNEVRFYCVSKTGTPDMRAALYAANTSDGAPNTSIEEKALNPTCPGWNDWTGFTTAITASAQYYIVVRNAAGTPGSNYAVLRRIPKMDYAVLGGSRGGLGAGWGWNTRTSSDSGSTWSAGNGSGGHAGMRLKFATSGYAGIPISSVQKDSTNEVYGTREAGAYFVIPSTWPTLKIIGISMPMSWSGTPPTQLRYRLYTGASPSLQATTQLADDEQLQQDMWVPLYFSSALTLTANQTVRIVAGTPSGGSAGNAYNVEGYTWDTDSNSRTLVPLSMQGTYYNGTSWAESGANVYPFVLLLDNAGEYSVSASGGLIGHNNVSGGAQ